MRRHAPALLGLDAGYGLAVVGVGLSITARVVAAHVVAAGVVGLALGRLLIAPELRERAGTVGGLRGSSRWGQSRGRTNRLASADCAEPAAVLIGPSWT